VVEEMGKDGRYGGRFALRSVDAAVGEGRTIYDGVSRRFVGQASLWEPAETPGAVRRLALEFITPLRMRTEGRYNGRPDFVSVTQSLLRRIHLLLEIYGEGQGNPAWTHELLGHADRAKTVQSEFRMYVWDRRSGRQGRRVQMDGVVGRLEAEGDLTDLAGWYRMGEWVHVGSGTSMGMGKYRMETED
jgi:CRISPR/Cas system endoribonuclease Cas6 (RAMP superfamily)